MTNIIPIIVFYFFSAVLIFSALMVVISRQPVRGVLFLVLGFFASAVLWMLLQAEFLALVLIFVYVGAVMTLFLFVVMMLNLDVVPRRKGWVHYLPFGLLVVLILLFVIFYNLNAYYFSPPTYTWVNQPANYSNVQELGMVLYTQYVYPFELAAVLLLVAIIAAISLTLRGDKLKNSKSQRISEQVAVRPKDRLRMLK